MARKSYSEQLVKLKEDVLKMGAMVEEAICLAVKSLKEGDVELAQQVVDGDDAIDDFTVRIEDCCITLLALQQPMARDLRVITTAIKITTDLERMADLAVDIAKVTQRISGQPLIKPLIDIPRMMEITQKMTRISLDAYVKEDPEMVHCLIDYEHEVDALSDQVFRELSLLMVDDPHTIKQAAQLLLVARFLERIAAHATNVGESTYYMVKGERTELNL
ncbi:MAG: phosphate signaling complex protein PhoU [Thermacetogeniaceae bacterium]|nr:phosphate signaling complex protein PhoU [Thermoanaerobacterales bacterium]HAF17831.1 phosphate transport system regulatory protein PhoU [Peptococcaceae bacterium]